MVNEDLSNEIHIREETCVKLQWQKQVVMSLCYHSKLKKGCPLMCIHSSPHEDTSIDHGIDVVKINTKSTHRPRLGRQLYTAITLRKAFVKDPILRNIVDAALMSVANSVQEQQELLCKLVLHWHVWVALLLTASVLYQDKHLLQKSFAIALERATKFQGRHQPLRDEDVICLIFLGRRCVRHVTVRTQQQRGSSSWYRNTKSNSNTSTPHWTHDAIS
eukprot:3368948-Amphidinium_carterae.2